MAGHRTLLSGGWVISMDPTVGDLRTGDVLVEDGRIEAIAPHIDAADAEQIDATGMIVLPGFVDTHRHTWQTCVRHRYADIDPQIYFAEMLGAKGAAFRTEDVYIGTLLGAVSALDSGNQTTVVPYLSVAAGGGAPPPHPPMKPGLPIPPGEPAINPVPRQMMAAVIENVVVDNDEGGFAVVHVRSLVTVPNFFGQNHVVWRLPVPVDIPEMRGIFADSKVVDTHFRRGRMPAIRQRRKQAQHFVPCEEMLERIGRAPRRRTSPTRSGGSPSSA